MIWILAILLVAAVSVLCDRKKLNPVTLFVGFPVLALVGYLAIQSIIH